MLPIGRSCEKNLHHNKVTVIDTKNQISLDWVVGCHLVLDWITRHKLLDFSAHSQLSSHHGGDCHVLTEILWKSCNDYMDEMRSVSRKGPCLQRTTAVVISLLRLRLDFEWSHLGGHPRVMHRPLGTVILNGPSPRKFSLPCSSSVFFPPWRTKPFVLGPWWGVLILLCIFYY